MASIEKRQGRNGKTHYRVKVRLKGQPTQSATFERKTDAQKWAQSIESAIREGRHFKTAEAKKRTFKEAVTKYRQSVLPTKRSQRTQGGMLTWWETQLGDYCLADITPALIADHRDKLLNGKTPKGTNRSSSTTVRYLAILSHVFTITTKEWGWTEENPVLKVTKPKEPKGRIRFLETDEIQTLINSCKNSSSKPLHTIVVIALSTGMRQGEILKLRWSDIDYKDHALIVHESKNDEKRRVPLTGIARDLVNELSKVRQIDTNLLFPSHKDPQKPIDIRAPWEKALRESDIADFRFHDLRHTTASHLAMSGASLTEIAEILGHKTLQMVKRYAHLSHAHTTSIVSKMNENIFTGG